VAGIRTMAAVCAGWGLSEPFYRDAEYRAFGAADVREFIELFWEPFLLANDANDMLAQIATWWHNDIGDHADFGGDFDAALAAIRCRAILLPADLDRYFPPVDTEYEARHMPTAEVRTLPGSWGHLAPRDPRVQGVLDGALRELLA
jgi:homoserine O-acetyltransferase